MKKTTVDILFLFLKNLLYAPNKAKINLEELEEEEQMLGQGLLLLGEYLKEQRSIAMALSKGDLTIKPFSTDNTLVTPLLTIQASLRHMTWQTQQVAKGNYWQKVEYMGEFSKAFNSMIEQLQEREDAINKSMELLEKNNVELQQTHKSFLFILENSTDSIVVLSMASKRTLYRNESASLLFENKPDVEAKFYHQFNYKILTNDVEGAWEIETDHEDEKKQHYFVVHSYKSPWDDEKAVVCIIRDITEQKREFLDIKKISYQDQLTGLYNRRYAIQEMEKLAKLKVVFSIAFIDIDFLKYCNDEYGHECGDQYIISVAKHLKKISNIHLASRMGGDEFLVVSASMRKDELEQALKLTLEEFQKPQKGFNHPKGFSYGVSEVSKDCYASVASAMKEADRKMYQFKLENKMKNIRKNDRVLSYIDDRIEGEKWN